MLHGAGGGELFESPAGTVPYGTDALSADGTRLVSAVVAGWGSASEIATFDWDGSDWVETNRFTGTVREGYHLGMSGDGLRLATLQLYPHVIRTYSWDAATSSWGAAQQITDTFVSHPSLAMSADGMRLVVGDARAGSYTQAGLGCPSDACNQGRLRMYQWDGAAWSAAGDMNGELMNPIGEGVAINGDGSRVVATSESVGPWDQYQGTPAVSVYDYVNGAWVTTPSLVLTDAEVRQHSAGVNEEHTLVRELSVNVVSMDDSGDVIALSAAAHGVPTPGYAKVYHRNGGSWAQRGGDIYGTQVGTAEYGTALALSDDGIVLAVGAPGNDRGTGDSNDNGGALYVYAWNGTAWVQLGPNLHGHPGAYLSQRGVSLGGGDGSIVAVRQSATGTPTGVVRVYSALYHPSSPPSPPALPPLPPLPPPAPPSPPAPPVAPSPSPAAPLPSYLSLIHI